METSTAELPELKPSVSTLPHWWPWRFAGPPAPLNFAEGGGPWRCTRVSYQPGGASGWTEGTAAVVGMNPTEARDRSVVSPAFVRLPSSKQLSCGESGKPSSKMFAEESCLVGASFSSVLVRVSGGVVVVGAGVVANAKPTGEAALVVEGECGMGAAPLAFSNGQVMGSRKDESVRTRR